MLLFSTLKLIALLVFVVMAVLGATVYSATRGGWSRNGYFTIPSVLLIVIALFIFFQGAGSGVTLALMGKNIEAHPVEALCINGLAEVTVLMLGAIVLSNAARQNLFAVFRLEGFRETPALAYLLAIPMMLVAQGGGVALSALFERFWKLFPHFYTTINSYENASDQSMQGLVTATSPLAFLVILVCVAIIPAIAEETLFRGFAQTNIERSGKWHTRPIIALLSASFLFALVHASLFKLPGLFALGLTLGWLTYRTNNLFTGALAHALNNGMIVAALYMNPTDAATSSNSNLVGTGHLSGTTAVLALVLLLPLMALLVYAFNRVTEHLDARGNAERELQMRLEHDRDSPHEQSTQPHE
ncbi:MAG TPA: CPBP family intramembrane glutamic endopeptidase [Candidatus Kapabacteria bacterium]|jgi:hypothetical protein